MSSKSGTTGKTTDTLRSYKLVSGYRRLVVWKEAKTLVVLIYTVTNGFPKSEQFGLTSQLRRAAVSVTSNIAEGWLRSSAQDKRRFLEIALGSLLEVESQLEVAYELKYLADNEYGHLDKKRAQVMYLLWRYKEKVK